MALHLALERIGRTVVTTVKSLAYLRDSLIGIRRGHPFLRLTGPQCDVVERQTIFPHSTIEYSTDISVAYDECFLEKLGRTVVVQTQWLVGFCRIGSYSH